jgi:AbrB family looped-hinge helix DNA binding protein
MRITSKGQVTIPADIRERAGLLPNTDVEFGIEGGVVVVRRAASPPGQSRGERLVARLRGKGDGKMTTDEIMALMRGD